MLIFTERTLVFLDDGIGSFSIFEEGTILDPEWIEMSLFVLYHGSGAEEYTVYRMPKRGCKPVSSLSAWEALKFKHPIEAFAHSENVSTKDS